MRRGIEAGRVPEWEYQQSAKFPMQEACAGHPELKGKTKRPAMAGRVTDLRQAEPLVQVLLEGLDGRCFVVSYVEDGVKLGDLEQVVNLFGEVQELQFAALVPDRGIGANEFANAGAIDICD